MLSVGFSFGFFIVVSSGAALFTEVNVAVPVSMYFFRLSHKKRISGHEKDVLFKHCLRCMRFWLTVWIGNITGAILVATFFKAGMVFSDQGYVDHLEDVLIGKMDKFIEKGALGWWSAFASAIAGNWLVGMAAFLSSSARSLLGKYIGVLPPVTLFVSLGLQHSPANMGYFMIALINDETKYTWGEVFGWNLIPASLGNIIGGSMMVGCSFFYAFAAQEERLWQFIGDELVTGSDGSDFGRDDDASTDDLMGEDSKQDSEASGNEIVPAGESHV
mmetsp:Transcript_33256/g.105156  ORF Transcript_33256/g.105156 Transcript_33256/m.105156 type:complete len:274 (+) Transcript_33256:164-985(+)